MIRCPSCDAEAPPGASSCPLCDTVLARECPSCGESAGIWMSFCPYCGGRIGDAAQAGAESSVRLATVLFGDVQGFTAMSERLPPEEVTDIMNACFDVLGGPIIKYEGTIDKYVGDAIMARFGAPKAHEDDPVRAIHAALEMQQALEAFAVKLQQSRGFELKMRIGINTGQVLAGEVGAAAFKQFTLMGNTVNLASRLEHEAEPGSALVGETTYRLARHAFDFKAMPPMSIRGQSELIRSYVPLRPLVGMTSSRSSRSGRRLALVGREQELRRLDRHLEAVYQGQGRLVSLVGEPGVGKSRLVEEFWARHQHENLVQIYASAPSFGESIPYSMLTSFIRGLIVSRDLDREITPQELRHWVTELLAEQRGEGAWSVADAIAVFGDMLDIASPGATDVSHLEAKSRQAMLINTLRASLGSLSRRQPLLIILEDLHWVDSASLSIFQQIVTGVESRPIMVLLTHRPYFLHPWTSLRFSHRIDVGELALPDARALLAAFFGSNAMPATVGERVMEKAGGNPFFLEQLLNNLIDSGAVEQRGGTWVPAAPGSDFIVPDTIQEIVQARIDGLPRGPRFTLEVAAVIGRVFPYRVLEEVVGADRDIQGHLRQLVEQDFVYQKSLVPELEYTFKHSLTHDVVYNALPEARRRGLHERVAEVIETLNASHEQLPLLAAHYDKTTNREKSIESHLAAAQWARERYANDEAIQFYQHALDLLDDAPHDHRMLTVLEALGDIHESLSDFEKAQASFERARAGAQAAGDQARLYRKLGDVAASRGHFPQALASYHQAEELLGQGTSPEEQVSVWLALARMDRSRGVLEPAREICRRALAVPEVSEITTAALYFELGEIERERGLLVSASGYLQAAASTWEELNALEKQALVAGALASVALNRGELAEARHHWEKALEIQQRVNDRQGIAHALYGIGRTALASGDIDDVLARSTEALTIATEIDDRILIANCLLQLGTAYLERADTPRAQELIGHAYDTFKRLKHWSGAAHAQIARARLMRARGDPDHARILLRRASALAVEMGDPWLQAQISIGEAELEEETGRLDLAAERAGDGLSMARHLTDVRLMARAERILGRVRARQRQRREALTLLASSVEAFRRSGAEVDAGRAALDYAVAAHGLSGPHLQTARQMLDFALATFDRAHSPHDLRVARAIALRLGATAPLSSADVPG